MNLDNCRIIVWGFKPSNGHYCTHSHIMEGFFRAAQRLRPGSLWLDQSDDLSQYDLSDCLFVTEHAAAKCSMPLRDDCFYVVHGMSDDAEIREKISSITSKRLSWNVYHDFSHVYGTQGNPAAHGITTMQFPLTEKRWLEADVPFYPREQHLDFRWATDLLPDEIERNKQGVRPLNITSSVINWVGTFWHVNEKEIAAFSRACSESGIQFRHHGAGQVGVVSVDDNVRLVRESYFAPAVVGSHHLTEGYAPCRIFKNISYGHMGVTNSQRVQDIFGGKLIFNTDPYRLFFDARDQLANLPVERVHALMDEVAQKHTYLNRLDVIFQAARMVMSQ